MKPIMILLLMTTLITQVHALDCDVEITPTLCGDITFLVGPNLKKTSDFEVTFFDKQKGKVLPPPMDLQIKLWMKMDGGHEHGSRPVKIQRKKEKITVNNVYFVMFGKWQIVFEQIDELSKKVSSKAIYWVDVQRSKK